MQALGMSRNRPRSKGALRRAGRILSCSLLIADGAAVHAQSATVEVNDSATKTDDFLCWNPVRARVRVDANPAGGSPLSVTISSVREPGGGAIVFQRSASRPNASTYATATAFALTLPADGGWAEIWVAGLAPSNGAKDVRIVVRSADGAELGALPVMVRVRKNADTLSEFETALFMSALAGLKSREAPQPTYDDYPRLHAAAGRLGIHRSPLFLPWHRAFLLDFERRLQEIDPRVAVPYWQYDRPSSRIFTPEFMGVTEPRTEFRPGGALERWADPVLGRLLRDPAIRPSDGLLDGSVVAAFDPHYIHFFSQLENRFHGGAHSRTGGWLAGPASPADPLFFLLHSNVDRAWARWQALHRRFAGADESSYSAQGAFPGLGPDAGQYPKGVYADDPMWPWARENENSWPAVDHPMPGLAASDWSALTPSAQLDYMGAYTGQGLGYCYDDIGFVGTPE